MEGKRELRFVEVDVDTSFIRKQSYGREVKERKLRERGRLRRRVRGIQENEKDRIPGFRIFSLAQFLEFNPRFCFTHLLLPSLCFRR